VNATLLLASLLTLSPDLAPPPGPSSAATATPPAVANAPAETTGWYGRSAVIADGASLSLLVGAMAAAGTEAGELGGPLALFGVGGYVFGGPGVHLMNGHPAWAVASVALRGAGLAGAGYFLLKHAYTTCNQDRGTTGPHCNAFSATEMLEISLPLAAAAAIDDLLLARGTSPASEASAPPAPTVTALVGPGVLSLRGTF
jgi:hypothetical protein